LAALGREDDARKSYQQVFPMLDAEPRCGRLDWERSSLYVNIGNTKIRQGNYAEANENYSIAEKLGTDHIEVEEGNRIDGMGMVIVAKRGRAFALKKDKKEDEGKKVLKQVIEMQLKLNEENDKKKAEEEAKKIEEAQAQQAQVTGAAPPVAVS
jgi:tetratricopeptide (TPR) repeat protein